MNSQADQPVRGPAAAGQAGYSIVLPPGWRRIPVRSGSKPAIKEAVREALSALPANAPPDKVGPYRMELERRLADMVRDARTKGAIDLCLPVLPVYGAPMAASFIVCEIPAELGPPAPAMGSAADEAPDPAQVLALLAAEGDDTRSVTVDGAMGVRIEKSSDATPASGVDFPSRHVNYVLSVPGDRGRWLAVFFSTLGGGNPDDQLAELLTGLFDAMMTTFRWGWEPE